MVSLVPLSKTPLLTPMPALACSLALRLLAGPCRGAKRQRRPVAQSGRYLIATESQAAALIETQAVRRIFPTPVN